MNITDDAEIQRRTEDTASELTGSWQAVEQTDIKAIHNLSVLP